MLRRELCCADGAGVYGSVEVGLVRATYFSVRLEALEERE